MATPIRIDQGTTRVIVVAGIVAADGTALTVTGWSVRAVARKGTDGPVLAEWVSGAPTGTQGQAVATGTEVRLTVTPAMSRAWTWAAAELHVHITESALPYREEDISGEIPLIHEFTTVY